MIGRPVLLINLLVERYNLVPVVFCLLGWLELCLLSVLRKSRIRVSGEAAYLAAFVTHRVGAFSMEYLGISLYSPAYSPAIDWYGLLHKISFTTLMHV